MAKKFLVRLSTTPQHAFGPSNGNQIGAEDIALRVASLLYDLAQLHVVEHVEAQCLVCTQSVVHLAANQVECAHADVIFGFWIGDFPGTMSEDEQRLEKSDHHLLARVLHDHAGKKHEVIGTFGFSIGQGARGERRA